MKPRNVLSAISPDRHDHDLGLAHDLRTLSAMRGRRQALRLLAGGSLLPLIACGTTGVGRDASASAGSDAAAGGGCRRHPRGDRRPLPRRRVERRQRPRPRRDCPRRHPAQPVARQRHGRGRPADGPHDPGQHDGRLRPAGRPGDLPVALRSGGGIFDVHAHHRELPARRPGDRRQRPGELHQRLPRLLRRPLAARALRGVPQRGVGQQLERQGEDVAAGVPRGRLQRRLRHHRVRPERHQPAGRDR